MAKRNLSNLSLDQLKKEIQRRQRRIPALDRKREKLLEQLEAVDKDIATLSGMTGGSIRKRPRNKMPLGDSLVKVLSKTKAKRVADIVVAVQKAGYKTSAKNFSTIVNQTLIKDKRFKKSGRGHYLLK